MAAVADKARRAAAGAGAGMVYGSVADANIVGPRTASSTTTDRPDRAGRGNERGVGDMPVDSQGFGKTEWTDTQNG